MASRWRHLKVVPNEANFDEISARARNRAARIVLCAAVSTKGPHLILAYIYAKDDHESLRLSRFLMVKLLLRDGGEW